MSRTLADRIQQRLESTGKSARGASLDAGLSDAFLRNILTGKSHAPRSDTVEKIAKVLGTTASWLLHEEGPEEPTSDEAGPQTKGFSPVIVPGRDLVGDKNLPVYAAAMGGDGHQIVTFEAIDYVKRPTILENVKNAYGVYIVGESMSPAFEPGDMALVNPHLPPARNKNVVLFHVPPTGDAECIVKRLVSFSDRDWHLQQFNPGHTFTETRADWPICHRIVGKYEAR